MNIIQISLLLFVAFAVHKTHRRLQNKDITRAQMLFWFFVWFAIAVAAVFPQWTVILANWFGVGRGSDFVLYVAVAALLYSVFKLTIRVQQLNRDITKLVRDKALKEKDRV